MKEEKNRSGESSDRTIRLPVVRWREEREERDLDRVAIEEPLEIRVTFELEGRRVCRSVAVTMRTPGHDLDLAAGFLLSEGVVKSRQDIWRLAHCDEDEKAGDANIVDVHLAPAVSFDLQQLSRNVFTTSACGVCGKSSIEAIRKICPSRPDGRRKVDRQILVGLPGTLRTRQPIFLQTGGLHAAALFDLGGELVRLYEDVGRHNALDKLTGRLLREDLLPADERIALVSGRASFELVHKALMAGIPILAAVGAPSSLAVELAHDYDMTLVGFLRAGGFNVYSGSARIDRG